LDKSFEGNWYANTLCSLAAVNFCLFIVGTVQVGRILAYQSTHKGSTEAGVKALGKEEAESAKELGQKAKAEL
jgi:hypothetical protein